MRGDEALAQGVLELLTQEEPVTQPLGVAAAPFDGLREHFDDVPLTLAHALLYHCGNLSTMATEVVGIFQGDIIIKSALEKCLKELKNDPGLVEDALAALPQDLVTADRYGNATITQCKKWFAETDVEVLLGLKFRYMEKPAIVAIELGDEGENETTLGDKNYIALEDHPRKPGIKRTVESLHSDASYTIAVFAHGEPELMLFLYSLVLFQLLRRKEDLLDARGYAVSKFSAGTAALIEPNTREQIFLRAIKLHGKVRHGWPKKEGGLIGSVPVAAIPESGQTATLTKVPFSDPNWLESDMLTGGFAVPPGGDPLDFDTVIDGGTPVLDEFGNIITSTS